MESVVGKVILIHGPSGSGKGTQSAILAKELGAAHISTGELLRQHSKMAADGSLADSADIISLLDEAISIISANQPIVFDGTARMPEEAKWLNTKLHQLGRKMSLVIELDIPAKETMKRLLTRGHERIDDHQEAIQKRLDWYHSEVAETLEYWETQAMVATVNGVGDVDEIAAHIKELVDAA